MRVTGSASATILPSPSLTFTDVKVGRAHDEPMMEVDRFEVTIELMPLLEGEIRVVSMKLDHPRARVVVDGRGVVDWLIRGESSKTLDPGKVVLEGVEIADGTVTYTDALSGVAVTAKNINALVEARSLAGPWRVEGSYLEGDTRVPFRFQTGRRLADGSIRVKTDISPARWPVAVAADGIVANGENGFSYAGTYNLTEVSLTEESEGGDQGWRSEGSFRLTRDRLEIDKAVLTEGPPDRPASLAGSLSADLGADARFVARIEARQLDLDRSLGKGPSQPVEVGKAVDSLVEWLGTLPVPSIPGRVRFNVPAIVVGGAIIQGVGFEASPQGGGWAIEGFHAQLPGQATLDADGMLLTGDKVGFGGNLKLAVAQPATFANWWRGRGEVGAGRLLAPFAFEGHATIGPGKVVVDSMEAAIGNASLSGRFAWTDASAANGRRLLETDITADRLDFVQLRAVAELLAGRNLADTSSLADSYAIKLAAQELVIADVRMRNVSVDADFVGGALTVRNVEVGDLGGAQFSATRGQIDDVFTAPRGHLEAHLGAPDLQGLARIIDRVAPDTTFSRWLTAAAPALSPAVVDVSVEAPPAGGGADYRIKLHASANASQADATIDLTGSPAAWRSGNAKVALDLSSYDAVGLARQAGFDAASTDVERSARLQVQAQGVPKDGLKTNITSDFGGLGLSAEGDLILAADLPPSFAGTLSLRSNDVDPIVRMAGLEIPGEAPGMGVALDGRIKLLGTTAELDWKDGSIAGRPVSAALRISGLGGPLEVDGTLSTDTVDLGWLSSLALGTAPLPTGDPETPWSQTPFGEPALDHLSGRLSVTAGKLAVAPAWDVTNIGLDVVLRPDRLDLDLREGQIAGGTVKGGVSIHNVGGNANLAGRLSMARTSLESFIWQRAGRAVATGTLDASANFEATGRSPAGLISALTGGGAINIHSGDVRYVNPRAASLLIKASDLGEQFSDEALTKAFAGYIDAGSMSFTEAEGAFAIAAGTIRLKSMSVDTKGAKTSGGATIDLNAMTVDSDWTLTLDPGDAEVEGTVPQVGIIFRGPLAEPVRTFDTLQLGSYLNIRQEARMQEILSQEEAARVEKERFNRLRRKLREDAERRAVEAKEAAAFAAAASSRLEAFHVKREVDAAERAAAELAVAQEAARRLAEAKAAAESAAKAAADRATEARAAADAASIPAGLKGEAAAAALAAAEKASADRVAAERAAAEAEAKAEATKAAAATSARNAEEKAEAEAAARSAVEAAASERDAVAKAAAEAAAAAEVAEAAAASLSEERAAAEKVLGDTTEIARAAAVREVAAAGALAEARARFDQASETRSKAADAASTKARAIESTVARAERAAAAEKSANDDLATAEAASSEATEKAEASVKAAVEAANAQAAAIEAKQKAAFEMEGAERSIVSLTAAEKATREKAANNQAAIAPLAAARAAAERIAADVAERALTAEATLREVIETEASARTALERATIERSEAEQLASTKAASSVDPISAAQATLDAASKVMAEGEAERAFQAAEAQRRTAEAEAEKVRAEKAAADRDARAKASAADRAALRAAVDRAAAERATAELAAAKQAVSAKVEAAASADKAALEAAAANRRARVANVEVDRARRSAEALVAEKREAAKVAAGAADAVKVEAEKGQAELRSLQEALTDAEGAEAAAKDVAAKAEEADTEAKSALKAAELEKVAVESALGEKAAAERAAAKQASEAQARAQSTAELASEKAAAADAAAERARAAVAERTAAEAAAKAATDLAQAATEAAKATAEAAEEKASAEESAKEAAERATTERAEAEKAAAEAAERAREAEAAAKAAADKAAAIAPVRASFTLDLDGVEDAGLVAPVSLEPGGLLPLSPIVESAPAAPRLRPALRPATLEAKKPAAAATKAPAKRPRPGPMNIVPQAVQ